MTDLPANVDLQWVGKTLLAMQAEQAAIRDELLVVIARANYVEASMDRLEAAIKVLTTEARALRNEVRRMNDRIEALEARP
jgi:phage shock protein A